MFAFVCLILCTCFLTAVRTIYEGDSCYESHMKSYGVCKRTNECRDAYIAYKSRNIRYDICSYVFDDIIVCCVEISNRQAFQQSLTVSTTQNMKSNKETNRQSNNRKPTTYTRRIKTTTNRPYFPARNQKGKRISEEKCEQYSRQVTEVIRAIPLIPDPEVTEFKQPKCDYISNPLVVGGNETDVGEFPHMAAIGWKQAVGDGYAWLCGGSLISERFVLTAGHCTFQDDNTEAESGAPSVVRLGDHDLRDEIEDEAEPTTVEIKDVIRHPEYKGRKKYHDIALLKLVEDVSFDNFVRPACLYTKPTIDDEYIIATGWGLTSFKGEQSHKLMKVKLDVYANDDCQANFEISRRWSGFSEDQMCAGDKYGGKDTCQGDSGGPLQVSYDTNRCLFYIVAVTGFGLECGSGYGVYAVVSHYVDWIENEVWIKKAY